MTEIIADFQLPIADFHDYVAGSDRAAQVKFVVRR